ncbi:MAG: bifunctional phosphoribosylaminoimidazolecarboxamide formyltransferase/IMP cyclohydrolase [Candidatus Jordarchaeaceae archaeon]
MRIKRALISVSDKTGIVDFAAKLHELGIQIIATEGTAKLLKDHIPVITVSSITNFPEMLDGRVKTLHPNIHAAILAKRIPEHIRQLEEYKISPIDLVVVNLYPFKKTIQENEDLNKALENIDIGGVALIRSAAKNYQDVVVVVNPSRYAEIMEELEEGGDISKTTREQLAIEAFLHTAEYDDTIASFLQKRFMGHEEFPKNLSLRYQKIQDLVYGENPHQKAAFYREPDIKESCVANAIQLHGKPLSFNNVYDADSAYELVKEFEEPAATIIKHTNPCGAAIGKTISEAYRKAYETDTVSAYGGIVGLNREVDKETAEQISSTFIEVVIAPGYTDDALKILKQKKNLRLLKTPPITAQLPSWDMKKVVGGLLVETRDVALKIDPNQFKIVSKRSPTQAEWKAALLGWKVVKHVKSNAIVLAVEDRVVGIGAGQMNRVDSARIAIKKAGENAKGSVLCSDGFIPFRDTVDEAANAGVTAIIQPGGSVRDTEVTAAADENNMAMIHTGIRHFKH